MASDNKREIYRLIRQRKIRRLIKSFVSIMPIVFTVIACFALIYQFIFKGELSSIEFEVEPVGQLVMISDLEKVKLSVENLRQMLDSLTIPNEAKTTAQLNRFRSEINEMKSSLNKIEEVILDDPVKALRLPLMEKELDNIRETFDLID